MKLRCRCCHGIMGLGMISAREWIPDMWWWETKRFCSVLCRDMYFAEKEDRDREKKATGMLYSRPP